MQVGDLDTEVALELGVGAVDVGARVVGVVADPHRDGRAPEAVAGDRPVARVRQPLAEDAVLDVAGVPVDVLVELDHAVADRRDAHEPGGDGLVDERLAAAPAVRVGVHVGGLAHQDGTPALVAAGQGAGAVAQVGDDGLVGLEDLQPGIVADLLGQAAAVVDGHDRLDAGLGAGDHVVLTEGRGHVHQAGSVGGGHEVGGDDRPGIRPRGGALGTVGGVVEVVEDRVVAPPHQVGPGAGGQHLRVLAELAGVGAQQVLRDNDVLTGHRRVEVLVDVDDRVLDVGPHGDGHVGGQRPGGGGPDEDQLGALGALAQRLLQAQAHRDRVVLAVLVDVVIHLELVVAQGGAVVPAVGQDAVALVGQTLVPQLLEGPQHRLHVVGVEGLVVVVEVDPAGLAGDVVLPLLGVAQDGGAALLVELLDADAAGAGDLSDVVDAEQALGLELGGQAVGVPAEAALDALAALGLVAPDGVLDVAGQQVAVVGQAVGEGRAVVEDELVAGLTAVVDGGLEGAVGLPVGQDVLLNGGEGGRGVDLLPRAVQGVEGGAGRLAAVGGGAVSHLLSHRGVLSSHSFLPPRAGARGLTRTTSAPDRDWCPAGAAPRYHLACRAACPDGDGVHDRFVSSCDGLSRPVLLRADGADAPGVRFFRRLAGDGRVSAFAPGSVVGGVPPGPVHAAARRRHPPHTRRWNSGGHHLP